MKILRLGRFARLDTSALEPTPRSSFDNLEGGEAAETETELISLLKSYQDSGNGYTSRRAVAQSRFVGDYDHLARFGEWNESSIPAPEDVG